MKSFIHINNLSAIFTQKLRFPLKAVALLIFFLFSVTFAQAQIKTWKGFTGSGFDWTLGTNWIGDIAPVANDEIVINIGGGTVNFSVLPVNVAYRSLSINGTVKLANGVATTLTIGGKAGTDLEVAAAYYKTLTLSTNVTIVLTTNSTATINGTMVIENGGIYNTDNAVTTVNYLIDNRSTVISSAAAHLVFNSGSTYEHRRDEGYIP